MNQLIRLGSWKDARPYQTVAVLDLGTEGQLLGIEILEASRIFGEIVPRAGDSVVLRVDRAADALYVRFTEGMSARQDVRDAVFYVDHENLLVGIELEAD